MFGTGTPTFALNHMTVPGLGWRDFAKLAHDLGCVGVELRNDLGTPLFGGEEPEEVGAVLAGSDLRILALSEVGAFNTGSDEVLASARDLTRLAERSGADAVALIPQVGGNPISADRTAETLAKLSPIFADAGVLGLIECVGFADSTLRDKAVAVDAIRDAGAEDTFKLLHDTFHHHLAGGDLYPDVTGLVHISGVPESVATAVMHDASRVLVGPDDSLNNITQLRRLGAAGYSGPASFEAFSPAVHDLPEPGGALRQSMNFITSALGAKAA